MQDAYRVDRRLSGIAAIGSGMLFCATTLYLFVVLPSAGFSMAMLDDRALLLPWLAEHTRLYGGLWILYFCSQALLLPVPGALARSVPPNDSLGAGVARLCARVGAASIVLAMVGLVIIYTTSPLIARAYIDSSAAGPSAASVLLLGDVLTDVGKEIRLFSEVLLGLWIGGTGAVLLRSVRARVTLWIMLGVGVYTLLVATVKILNPSTPLEDTLGLLLALGYVSIGVELVRSRSARAPGVAATAPPPLR